MLVGIRKSAERGRHRRDKTEDEIIFGWIKYGIDKIRLSLTLGG